MPTLKQLCGDILALAVTISEAQVTIQTALCFPVSFSTTPVPNVL
jgi:hypothetical protein